MGARGRGGGGFGQRIFHTMFYKKEKKVALYQESVSAFVIDFDVSTAVRSLLEAKFRIFRR